MIICGSFHELFLPSQIFSMIYFYFVAAHQSVFNFQKQ